MAQREPARSTGGDRPSGTDMKRVAAARTTGRYRKSVPGTPKHTGGSRTSFSQAARKPTQEGARSPQEAIGRRRYMGGGREAAGADEASVDS